MHKQLLLEVRKQPLGTEVALCFGLDMIPLTGYIVGKEKVILFKSLICKRIILLFIPIRVIALFPRAI